MFSQRYADGDMPWDSGITPPEIFDILGELPPGRALDLGCGTGTVIRDLLHHGWQADGIDFVPRAIDLATTKLADFPPDSRRLVCGDVTGLEDICGLRPPYDLIIDIGCGHSIDKALNLAYAGGVSSHLNPGGCFMLYASHPRPESTVGWTPLQVAQLFNGELELHWEQRSYDAALGLPSSWYRLRKP
ncbi:MAG: methyltransferase domain-containing protein [Chloroflexi bacterium]|nr:methyltransferase domain-containing protein [Chloroflexota bacterium]